MLAKIYMLRFTHLNDARHAATFMADGMVDFISTYNITGLTILLRKEGAVQVIARFDDQADFQRVQANDRERYPETLSLHRRGYRSHHRLQL